MNNGRMALEMSLPKKRFKFYARITTYVRADTEEEALEKLHEMGERTHMYILDVESTEEVRK